MSGIPKNKTVSITLTLLGFIAAGYQIVAYTGLYRLLCELQLSLFGMYFQLLSMVPLGIFLLPGLMTEPPKTHVEMDSAGGFATWEEGALYRSRKTIRRLRLWVPLAFLGVIGPIAYAQMLPSAAAAPKTVDISLIGASSPPLGPVTLIGTPDLDHRITLSTRGRDFADNSYVPLLGRGFDGQVRYVVYLGSKDYENNNSLYDVTGTGRITGSLSQDALGGEVRAAFEKNGVKFAEPYFVLDRDIPAPRSPYYYLAGFAGIALIVMLIFLVRAIRTRRLCTEEIEGWA